jgi:hypothetical protein
MPVNKLDTDVEYIANIFKSETAVGLQKLDVCQIAHLSVIVASEVREVLRAGDTSA